MNDILFKQLSKCQVANIPDFNYETKELLIPKLNQVKIDLDCCYLVELSDFMVNPPNNSTLVTNWNNGTHPTYKNYRIDVSKIMNKMVYVEGIAFDIKNNTSLNSVWRGWIPITEIKVLEKL